MARSAVAEAPKTQTENSMDEPNRSQKKDFFYIVAVLHDMDHGQIETVIYLTKSPYEAVETARKVEEMGYRFYSDETGASVYRLEIDRQYNQFLFRLPENGKIPADYPIVFRRYKKDDEWHEEWFSDTLKFIMGLH